jgi:hypothetical protein
MRKCKVENGLVKTAVLAEKRYQNLNRFYRKSTGVRFSIKVENGESQPRSTISLWLAQEKRSSFLSKFGRFGLTYKNFYRIIPMAKSAV